MRDCNSLRLLSILPFLIVGRAWSPNAGLQQDDITGELLCLIVGRAWNPNAGLQPQKGCLAAEFWMRRKSLEPEWGIEICRQRLLIIHLVQSEGREGPKRDC